MRMLLTYIKNAKLYNPIFLKMNLGAYQEELGEYKLINDYPWEEDLVILVEYLLTFHLFWFITSYLTLVNLFLKYTSPKTQ